MRFAGRFMGHALIVTKLDDVPPGLRVNAAALIVTEAEASALGAGDPVVKAQMRRVVDASDRDVLEQRLREAGE